VRNENCQPDEQKLREREREREREKETSGTE